MPPVTPYGGRRIARAPLANARLTAASTPLAEGAGETGGEGLIAIGSQITRLGVAAVTGIAERERNRADQVARLKWQNQFADFETARINDPEKGALAQRGEAAFPLPEQIDADFETLAGTIESSLTTERQRLQFAADRLTMRSSIEGTVRRHVRDQIQTFEGEQLTARVTNARNAAGVHAADPRRVGLELTAGEEAIRSSGPRLGMPPEQVDAEVVKFKSATHVDVISNLLESQQTSAARVYFDEASAAGEISGDALDGVKRALREGTVRQNAQRETARILATGGTLAEQRTAAKAIADADVQDEVLRRIEHEETVQRGIERDVDETRMRTAADILDRTRDVTRIPPGEWAAMSPAQRSSLRSYVEQLTKSNDVETDWNTFYRLMNQAGTDPEAFANVNITDFIGRLSKQDREQLAGLQLSIRNADRRGTAAVIDGFMTNQQIVNDVLLEAGLDATPQAGDDSVNQVIALRREVDRQVQALQTATGKKATNEDVRAIADSMFRKVVIEGSRSWLLGSDEQRALIDLPAADRIQRMTLTDMPPSLRALAEDSLRRHGQSASDAEVLALYRRFLISQLPQAR